MPALLIEKKHRLIISILFRLLIILYSIFILYIADSIFSWKINLAIYIIYILFFVLSFAKDGFISICRLVNDYVFIFLILYQFNNLNIFSYALLLAPILNSQNHSSEKKSLLLYLLPLLIIFIVSDNINFLFSIPFLLFWIINLFEGYRTKYIRFHERLNSRIDDYFMKDFNKHHPYKIYKECIPILNEKPFDLQVEDIYCFKYDKKNSSISVVNGSKFIWNYNMDLDIPLQLKKKDPDVISVKNVSLKLNNKMLNNNIVLIYNLKSMDVYYLFFLITTSSSSIYNLFGMEGMLLNPLFSRMIKVFEADLKQKNIEKDKMQELGAKMNYVNSAVKSMHYIRNKLGPIKNYMSMQDDYNNASDEKKMKIEPYLKNESKRVEQSLNMVLDRANYILEKSNNPFVTDSLDKYGIQQLFSDIRRIWKDFCLIENFEFNLEENFEGKKFVFYNKIGMELLLTNWISNIYKYNAGEYGLTITETDVAYCITFFNSTKTNQNEDLDFIKHFTSNDRLEIDKRKSHGLAELKEFLTQMNIQGDLSLRNNNVEFSITLIKKNEEGINI